MPELNPKALHGLAGKLAERVQPQMEVSAVAVAADYLCALGNCVGPKVRTFANGDFEAGNFNVLKPGLTGVAKSHTAKPVERVFTTADPFWNERIEYDVYTPQALLADVSDYYKDREGELVERPTVEKQRLYRVDELSKVFARGKNPESTLLQYMNDAFDRRPMAIKTLAAAERGATRSTGHFLSFIGNTTPEVLREASGLAAGGFLNRFLFVWVERRDGVLIPRPEQVELSDLRDETAKIVQHWRKRGEVVLEWTPAAEHSWDELYPSLTQPWPGIYGQMRVRGRVFVARLALVYAISDRSEVIDVEHVEAAHALWEYHVQSVERVFGTVTGNVHSDRIVAYLQEHGRATKAELNKEACGNHPEACDRGLAPLFEYGLIEVEEVAPQGERKGGRRRQVYRLA